MEPTHSGKSLIDISVTAQRHNYSMNTVTVYDTISYMYAIGKATALKTIRRGYDLWNTSDINAKFRDIVVFIGACYGYKNQGNMSDC